MLGFNVYNIISLLFFSIMYTGLSAKRVKLRNKDYDVLPIDQVPADTVMLDLTGNEISEMNSTDLRKLVSLEDLRMNSNKFLTFPDLSAVGETLRILRLEDNEIVDVPDYLLTELSALEELHMSNNNLTVIPAMKKKGNLWKLRLGVNQINSTTTSNFQGMPNLKELYLNYNRLSYFPDLFYVRKTLQVLWLDGNLIAYIPDNLLDQMVALTRLFLNENQLSTIPDVSGPGKTLFHVRFLNNSFREYPKISNIGRNLKMLFANYNGMERIPPENFVFENRNESVALLIDLEFNPIKTLPPVVGTSLEGCEIRLRNTSMVCDMNLAWLTFLKSTYIEERSVCESPLQLQNRQIGNLTLSDLESTLPKDKPKIISSLSHLTFSNIYSNILPMITTYVQSPLKCLLYCTVTPGCVYVNYHTGFSSDVGHLCHYSSPLKGEMLDKPASETGWKYYSVNSANN